MANLMSVRAITSPPQCSTLVQTNKIKVEKHAIVCLFSRGNNPVAIRYVSDLAKNSGMPQRLHVDVTNSLDLSTSLFMDSPLPIHGNERDEIIHNIYMFHGGILNGKHFVNVRHGDIENVSTSNLLRSTHWQSSMALGQANLDKKNKNIGYHFSCHSAKLRDEFSADEAFWKSNISLIFSSKKVTAVDHMGTALESTLRYASYCNDPANQSTLDQFKLFLHAGLRRGDCLTMLGGELKAPLIWHAPKNHDDLLLQNISHKVRGHALDCARLKQAILALTVAQLDQLPPERAQLRDMFFTRISRDDLESVVQILRVDSSLINERSLLGSSALNWSMLVGANRCADYLLSAGADVNASDGYHFTPLDSALRKDNPELVRNLLTKGANPNVRNQIGNSPLMIAASRGWLGQVQALLEFRAKIDVWNNGHTALTLAVEQGDYEIVDALIMAGADASSGLDQKLIMQAEEQDDMSIVDLLERRLNENSDNNGSVDMEIDRSESQKQ